MIYLQEIKSLKKKMNKLTNEELTSHIMRIANKFGVDPMEVFLKLDIGLNKLTGK